METRDPKNRIMKSAMKVVYHLMILILNILFLSSCKKYLDRTPTNNPTDQDVFGTYESFQGFIDPNYAEIVDYNQWSQVTTMNYGGDVYSYNTLSSGSLGNNGEYLYIAGDPPNASSLFANSGSMPLGPYTTSGISTGGWRGIRVCNIALEHLDLLTDATNEEKNLIKGQIYFFRAFFHQGIIEAYGGMCYVDTVFASTDRLLLPRISYQDCTERIVQDYDKAIALLPGDWDSTVVGKAMGYGSNTGRATKGAAMAYRAKALLYASSPLMNRFSGASNYTYNIDYAQRAAAAGWDFINYNNTTHTYSLVPFSNYSDMFYKADGTMPWTAETIFQRMESRNGSAVFTDYIGRKLGGPVRFGGYDNCESVNQAFIDKFEMADGTRYKTEYDNDSARRWNNRDTRFMKNIITDRERWGFSPSTVINLYEGQGTDKTIQGGIALPYLVKKYWPKGVNGYDRMWDSYRTVVPRMRLAEVYLDYAEAVTVAYGPSGSPRGSGFTAVDAINIVRARCGMPAITAAAAGYANFLDLVRNERNVELCFEGHYWFDIRRWHIAHLTENKTIIDLHFDKDWTSFTRSVLFTRVFEDPKYYWLPIPKNFPVIIPFYQNPGW